MTQPFLTQIVLPADPTAALQAATKQYVDQSRVHHIVCTIDLDPLIVGTGIVQFIATRACTIIGARPTTAVGKAPTGSALIFDVNKNATTIFTTQGNRPTIAISATTGSLAVPDVTAMAAGDVLTVDIDQIGSTYAGGLATVSIGIY